MAFFTDLNNSSNSITAEKSPETFGPRSKLRTGAVYGFIHFSVEVVSFYFLFSRVSTGPYWWAMALLFDAIAFLPQGFFGIITDRYLNFNIGLTGALMMTGALLIPFDFPALLVLCLGNAMIHVSGAQQTLRGAKGKITPNALFIGAGSFGVITGQLLGSISAPALVVLPLALMAASIITMVRIHRLADLRQESVTFRISADRPIPLIVLLAFIDVIVRGYIAYAIPTEWNKSVVQAVALFLCMGIGKTLGGVLCDRIGFRRVTFLSLLGGLPFLLAGNRLMLLSLIGVALFSMTMPVTVGILASAFPKRPGFAFGITTTGLFLGSAPAFFIRPQTLPAHQITVLILTAVALPATILCIKKGR